MPIKYSKIPIKNLKNIPQTHQFPIKHPKILSNSPKHTSNTPEYLLIPKITDQSNQKTLIIPKILFIYSKIHLKIA